MGFVHLPSTLALIVNGNFRCALRAGMSPCIFSTGEKFASLTQGGRDMLYIASKILFFVALLRLSAIAIAAGAVVFGVYVLIYDSILTGLAWIFGAAIAGWVINRLFGLVHMLGSAVATSPIRSPVRK
jgi:hypothetical protein